MADEGFHEIQLSGKHLVALFMAATVVAVVIFLCGVMVGRDVDRQRVALAAAASEIPTDPTAEGRPSEATADPTSSQPAPSASQETLSYPDRLSSTSAPTESLKPQESAPAERVSPPPPPRPAEEPRATRGTRADTDAPSPRARAGAPAPNATAPDAPAPDAPVAPAAPVAPVAPSASGFTVQVAAVADRGEADSIAQRLTKKGYPAYVMAPAAGAPRVFRIRVGRYTDRREAERIAGRLQKEEQFKPWITR